MSGFMNFAAFEAAFKASGPLLEAAGLVELRGTAEEIVAVAKRYASDLEYDPRDPEPLADTIAKQGEGIDAKGPYVDVGTRSPHGLFQEFGTVNDPAHPFMRPAIAEITASNLRGEGLNLAPRKSKTKK